MLRSVFLFLTLFLALSSAHAEEFPTYVVPESVFNTFSKEKRIEYVKSVMKILMQHEKTFNYDYKFSGFDIFLSQAQAQTQAIDAAKFCIIGAKKIPRDATTKICTTQIASPCGSPQLKFQCGSFNLNKCVDREPKKDLSKRCYETAIADEEGLKNITQPQIEEAVKMYYSACNTVGDNHGCFFLAQQLKHLGTIVGKAVCDNMADDEIIAAGNILNGNGNPNEKTQIPFLGKDGKTKTVGIGDVSCAKCHGATLYNLTERERTNSADQAIKAHIIKMGSEFEPIKAKIKSQVGGENVDAALAGIGCILGRLVDLGARYPSIISSEREDWKMPPNAKPIIRKSTGGR